MGFILYPYSKLSYIESNVEYHNIHCQPYLYPNNTLTCMPSISSQRFPRGHIKYYHSFIHTTGAYLTVVSWALGIKNFIPMTNIRLKQQLSVWIPQFYTLVTSTAQAVWAINCIRIKTISSTVERQILFIQHNVAFELGKSQLFICPLTIYNPSTINRTFFITIYSSEHAILILYR
jgi:hypothetical protein